MSDYTAVCERDGKWWEVTVPELPAGSVTQVKRLGDVDKTVRALVHLMTGEYPATVTMKYRLPDDLCAEVARARQLREQADTAGREAIELSRDAAVRLAADGLPVRDIGQILGISYQRAQQLKASH